MVEGEGDESRGDGSSCLRASLGSAVSALRREGSVGHEVWALSIFNKSNNLQVSEDKGGRGRSEIVEGSSLVGCGPVGLLGTQMMRATGEDVTRGGCSSGS